MSAAVGRAFTVHPLLSHMMPTFRKAHRHHKTALLRVVEALVERLFRLGQAPQRIGSCRECVGVAAEKRDRIGLRPSRAAGIAPCVPSLAIIAQRLFDRSSR